jgi:hypothetical protein
MWGLNRFVCAPNGSVTWAASIRIAVAQHAPMHGQCPQTGLGERPETWVTFRTGRMGYTFRFFRAGGVKCRGNGVRARIMAPDEPTARRDQYNDGEFDEFSASVPCRHQSLRKIEQMKAITDVRGNVSMLLVSPEPRERVLNLQAAEHRFIAVCLDAERSSRAIPWIVPIIFARRQVRSQTNWICA